MVAASNVPESGRVRNTLEGDAPESAGRIKFPADPGVMFVQIGAPSFPPAELSLNCHVRVGVAPAYEKRQANTPKTFVLGTVPSNGTSKSRLNETIPPDTGIVVDRLTKLASPSSLLMTAPPATGATGFHAEDGAPSVVATADRYGMSPLPVVPVNCSLFVVENDESSQDSRVGLADKFWLNPILNTFLAELLFPAPVTLLGIDIAIPPLLNLL
jgi:hypothetical protein